MELQGLGFHVSAWGLEGLGGLGGQRQGSRARLSQTFKHAGKITNQGARQATLPDMIGDASKYRTSSSSKYVASTMKHVGGNTSEAKFQTWRC